MLTRAQAIKLGFTIDNGTEPVAYKGPRFSPTEWHEIMTEREEATLRVDTSGKTKARVIITMDCPRNCKYCCNKYNSIIRQAKRIESVTFLSDYDQVYVTGGEPMYQPGRLIGILQQLAKQQSEVFLYTALFKPEMATILPLVKGVHFSLHAPVSNDDIAGFNEFQRMISKWFGSYRLYIDPEIDESIAVKPSVWSRVEIKPWLLEHETQLPVGEDLFILDQ